MRVIIAILFSFTTFFQDAEASVSKPEGEYLVILKNGKKGLSNKNGEVLIPAIYDDLGWSDNTTSPVNSVIGYKKGNSWGLISVSNKKIIPPSYVNLSPGVSGQVIASRKGKFSQTSFYGTISTKGSTVIPFIYYSISKVEEVYLALVRKQSKLNYGIIDAAGIVLLPFDYVLISPVSDRLVGAEREGLLTIYNVHQRKICLDSINRVELYYKDHLKVYQMNHVGLINEEGALVVPIEYRNIKKNDGSTIEAIKHSTWNVLESDNSAITILHGDKLDIYGDKIRLSSPDHQALYNADYKRITPAHFVNITNVVGNKLVFGQGDKYGLYDLDKEEKMKFLFDSLYLEGEFFYGYNNNVKRKYWSVYDTFAVKRSKFEYEQILPYKNHLFAVKRRDHWGFMNRNGIEVIHCVYDSVGEINNDLITVKYHNNYGVIDKEGSWVVLPRKEKVKMLADEVFLSFGFVTTTLEHVNGDLLYFTDNSIQFIDGSLVESLPDGKVRRLDVTGTILNENEIVVANYGGKKYINDDYVAVKINGSYGMIDRASSELRITNRYQDVGRVSKGLVSVQILGKWGIIDLNEKLIVQPIYDHIFQFNNDLAIVSSKGKWGIIGKAGEHVLVPKFDVLERLVSGNFKTKKDNKFGLVNAKGRIVINTKYESLLELPNGYAIIEKGGKFGVVTENGVNTIPQIYDQIIYDHSRDRYYAQTKKLWRPLNYEL